MLFCDISVVKEFYQFLFKNIVFDIDDNKKGFLNTKSAYRMISEGSCDTEDWNNDAENSALHHRNKLHLKYFQIESRY